MIVSLCKRCVRGQFQHRLCCGSGKPTLNSPHNTGGNGRKIGRRHCSPLLPYPRSDFIGKGIPKIIQAAPLVKVRSVLSFSGAGARKGGEGSKSGTGREKVSGHDKAVPLPGVSSLSPRHCHTEMTQFGAVPGFVLEAAASCPKKRRGYSLLAIASCKMVPRGGLEPPRA